MAVQGVSVYAVMALVMLLQPGWSQAQTTFTVGGNNAWTFPPNGVATYYNDWAKSNFIKAGDSLFFNYESTFHNVMQVSKADLDSCSAANAIKTYTEGNSTVLLPTAGYYGFICSVPSHCEGNMKMEVNVLNTDGSPAPMAAPAPPVGGGPSSSPGGAPGPAAPQNGAISKHHAVSVVALATALAASAFLSS